jgi:V-type H+-transporting ATPase subunit a
MFLGMGGVEETALIYSTTTQEIIQMFILLIAFISVPTMLFVKPLILSSELRRKEANELGPCAIELGVWSFKKRKYSDEFNEEIKSDSDDEDQQLIKSSESNGIRKRFGKEENKADQFYNPKDDPWAIDNGVKTDEARNKLEEATKMYKQNGSHDMQEIWIHQLIETIEFVLGTISNTASYLRLWALSLAHSQLADVFYDKLMKGPVEEGQWYLLFFILPMYLTANFTILVWMDSMECFLHTLRLHWVEFQNKFFKGTGYKFNTFSLTESTGFKSER